jgi:hypothetical protein
MASRGGGRNRIKDAQVPVGQQERSTSANRKLSGFHGANSNGKSLVGSDHRGCCQFWEDYGAKEVIRLLGMSVCGL